MKKMLTDIAEPSEAIMILINDVVCTFEENKAFGLAGEYED